MNEQIQLSLLPDEVNNKVFYCEKGKEAFNQHYLDLADKLKKPQIIREVPFFYYTKRKFKQTGFIIEISKFEPGIMIYSNRKKKKRKKKVKQNSREKSMYRAKRLIYDYIHSNAWHWYDDKGQRIMPLFITLTFKENIKDLEYANYEYTKFIRRLNYEMFNTKKSVLKYVCIVEFQKRGAIHYHLVSFNIPYIKNIYDVFKELWPHGFSLVESINTKKGTIAGYLTKYITKEKMDDRLSGRKSYFISRGLHKPIVTSIQEVVSLLEIKLKDIPVIYNDSSFFSIGKKTHERKKFIYDLKNYPEAYTLINEIVKTYDY